MKLDESSEHGLSQKRSQRDRKSWASDEATALYELLSYTRRYWRKALKRKTQGRVTMIANMLQCMNICYFSYAQ